jgi:hypothetical protein
MRLRIKYCTLTLVERLHGLSERQIFISSEALALSYVVARSIGLESLFHDDVSQSNLLRADEIDWQFRQRIRSAAFALLTNLSFA